MALEHHNHHNESHVVGDVIGGGIKSSRYMYNNLLQPVMQEGIPLVADVTTGVVKTGVKTTGRMARRILS